MGVDTCGLQVPSCIELLSLVKRLQALNSIPAKAHLYKHMSALEEVVDDCEEAHDDVDHGGNDHVNDGKNDVAREYVLLNFSSSLALQSSEEL